MAGMIQRNRNKIPLVAEMICALITLPLSFNCMRCLVVPEENETPVHWLCAWFVVVGCTYVFRAFRWRKQSKAAFVLRLVTGAVLALCAVAVEAAPFTPELQIAVGMAYYIMLLAGRVLSVVRRPKVGNILANVAAALVIFFFAAGLILINALFIAILIGAMLALASVTTGTFSRFRTDILREIIRKTYAAEIVFGLLLLIVAFSYVLAFIDESFPSFWDGLWYCFAVVTTIGFGDITPATPVGRLMSVVLGVYGIVVVALITSIIVNFYGEMKKAGADEDKAAAESGEALP